MTKRIFATVLALILCFTTLAIPTFAASAGSTTLVQTSGTNDVVATWPNIPGAAIYEAKLYVNNTQVGGTHTVSSTGVASYNCKWTVSAAGTYTVQIIGKASAAANSMQVGSTLTASCNVTTSVNAGDFVFTKTGNTVTVDWSKWKAPTGVTVTNFNVLYTITGKAAVTKSKIGNVTSFVIPEEVKANEGVTVTVQYCTAANDNAGNVGTNSLTASGTGATGGSNNSTTTGLTITNIVPSKGYPTLTNGVLTWTDTYATSTSARNYSIEYYVNNAYYPTTVSVNTNSWTVPAGTTKAVIKGYNIIFGGYYEVCTVTFSGSTTSSGSLNYNAATKTVYWNAVTNATKYEIYINGGVYFGSIQSTSFSASQTAIISVKVVAVLSNGTTMDLGTVSTTGGNVGAGSVNGSTSGSSNYFTANGLTVSKNNNYTTISWEYSGDYLVTYQGATDSSAKTVMVSSGNSVQLPFSYNDTFTVKVVSYPGYQNIGSVTVYPTGSTAVGGNESVVTTVGSNCTVYSNSTSAQVVWNATAGMTYSVIYTVGDSNTSQRAYSTTGTVTLPVGHSDSISIIIIDSGNNLIGSANVKKTASSVDTSNAVTKIDGLELEFTNGGCRISWDKVSGAYSYYVLYGLYGSAASQEAFTKTNYVDIRLGVGKSFNVYVYAVASTGKMTTIGTATYIAGSDPSDDDNINVDGGYDFVTNFKGTQGNKKLKLTWDAAEDCDKYDIYMRTNGTKEWKKVGSTKKLAVNLSGSGIKNGTKYDFKIVANGNDSGILTIAPSATSTNVVRATDPVVEEEVVEVPVISSASGGKGTATIKWSKVDDATEYKVFFATKDSNKYKSKGGSVKTNVVTINNLEAGTYKVRVKALVDGEWTSLSDCDYVTVVVK